MRVDQAIYTSMRREGRDGYHVVSRSRGVSEADARALASWSPSHGGLIVDDANHASVNVHPLPEGRLALSRTCEGPPEYSGRGGRQIYTHALILDPSRLDRSGVLPIALYRDAMALGLLRHRPDPDPVLDEVELGRCHRPAGADPREGDPGPADLVSIRERLVDDQPVTIRHGGDRIRLAERLLGRLPAGLAVTISLSTSLQPSSARPFLLSLIG